MEQAKVTFLASFSHELRTPLNGLLGMLELLKDLTLQKEATRYIAFAFTSATLLLNLINDILDLSKIEAGKLEVTQRPFNVKHVLESAAQLLVPQAASRGLDLTVEVVEPIPYLLCGDADRIRQVLLNLLSNAIKFTKQGGISILARVASPSQERPDASMIEVYVKDTGTGIRPNDLEKMFSLFTKLADTRALNPTGSGLGLAICKQLVGLMGGEISVSSQYGQGTTFFFTIAGGKVDEKTMQEHRNQPTGSDGHVYANTANTGKAQVGPLLYLMSCLSFVSNVPLVLSLDQHASDSTVVLTSWWWRTMNSTWKSLKISSRSKGTRLSGPRTAWRRSRSTKPNTSILT
jgi:K+-sensing histidine kinase KdpD